MHIGDFPGWARTAANRREGSLPVRVGLAAKAHRTTGHAAEMAFFAVLTLVPSTVAVGSALGLSESVIGAGTVARAENAAVEAVQALMGPELADRVISPFIHAQLAQPRGGVALGSLLAAWWLSSHLFMSTSHALDQAYGVRDRRSNPMQRLIALGFALGSVAVVAFTVELMVSGPLPDIVWTVVRWPLLLALVVAFLMALYRYSPNVRQRWRDCLPGALAGAALWIFAAVAFRLSAGMRGSFGVAGDDPVVAIIGQAVNAVVATVLWAYLASIAILLGGEVNAALNRRHEEL